MRVAERHAFAYEVIGQVRCSGESFARGGAHVLCFHADAAHHVGVDDERLCDGVDGVEQRLFIFLVVLVVGQRLALHQGCERHQMPLHARHLASHEFGDVRVFLLRHDRRAGAKTICNIDEAKARAHPQNQLFAHARKMHHRDRAGVNKFNCEVTVANSVQRIAADGLKTERLRGHFAINRKRRPGERRGAERRAVYALAAIDDALVIARKHFHVRHQVVAQRHRHRHLQMGETGDDRVGVLFGKSRQRLLQLHQQMRDLVASGAGVKAHVGSDLIVARATGVQALTGVADERRQALFDIEVHVFKVKQPLERACRDFGFDLGHAAFDVGQVLRRDHVACGEHARMRERTGDVELREAVVKRDRRGVALDDFGDRLVESARPTG